MSKEELSNDKEQLGIELRNIRTRMEMTQDEVVDRSGLGRNQVISIEKGKGNPTIDTLFKYLDAVGARLDVKSQW